MDEIFIDFTTTTKDKMITYSENSRISRLPSPSEPQKVDVTSNTWRSGVSSKTKTGEEERLLYSENLQDKAKLNQYIMNIVSPLARLRIFSFSFLIFATVVLSLANFGICGTVQNMTELVRDRSSTASLSNDFSVDSNGTFCWRDVIPII